jgi:hypothetical protein
VIADIEFISEFHDELQLFGSAQRNENGPRRVAAGHGAAVVGLFAVGEDAKGQVTVQLCDNKTAVTVAKQDKPERVEEAVADNTHMVMAE